MKTLVDTSVWIDFFNGQSSPPVETLVRLISDEEEIATCGVIIAEYFQGIRDDSLHRRLRTYFDQMTYLRPREPESYYSASALFRALRKRGLTVRSTIDCLIVVLAEENGFNVLAKDRDFGIILKSGLTGVQAAV